MRIAYPPSAQATKLTVRPARAKYASPATAGMPSSIAIVGTSTRLAAEASVASAAAKSIAVRAEAATNGDRTGSRRSVTTIRGPWARYAPTRTSNRAASRMLSTSGTACAVPSTGTAACHAWASPAMPKTTTCWPASPTSACPTPRQSSSASATAIQPRSREVSDIP